MALLLVLAILAATTILAAHMMLVSESVARDASVAAITGDLKLKAESAADFAFWMHLTDRRLFSNRSLGSSVDSREEFSDFEPWMLDKREHLLFDDTCSVYLGDALKAVSVDNLEKLKESVDVDDSDALDSINQFIDVYNDYTDSNDLLNLYGMEADDYAAKGYRTLPRNNAMQFKAEIYWLENWIDIIPSEITVIPPKGVSLQNKNAKIPFFTASDSDFTNAITDLSESELEAIKEARDLWIHEGIPIEETLDGDLLINLKNRFSFAESNYAEITAVARDATGEIKVAKTITREVNARQRTIYADRAAQTFSIWEARYD